MSRGKAYTWGGILGHLSLVGENLSGSNGLATWSSQGVMVSLGFVDISRISRSYGEVPAGSATLVGANISQGPPIGPLRAAVRIVTSVSGLQVGLAVTGSLSLSGLVGGAQRAARGIPGIGSMLGRLPIPTINISGQIGIAVGMTGRNIPFMRIQTGGGVQLAMPGVRTIGNSAVRGGQAAAGRSWQIRLDRWGGQWPR